MTGLETVAAWTGAAAGIVSTLSVIAWAIRRTLSGVRSAVHTIDAIEEIVAQELTHNHGSSIKDDVTGLACTIGLLQREVGDIATRVDTLAHISAKHHPDDGWQIFPDKETP